MHGITLEHRCIFTTIKVPANSAGLHLFNMLTN